MSLDALYIDIQKDDDLILPMLLRSGSLKNYASMGPFNKWGCSSKEEPSSNGVDNPAGGMIVHNRLYSR